MKIRVYQYHRLETSRRIRYRGIGVAEKGAPSRNDRADVRDEP
jgi:hypothetical protein